MKPIVKAPKLCRSFMIKTFSNLLCCLIEVFSISFCMFVFPLFLFSFSDS